MPGPSRRRGGGTSRNSTTTSSRRKVSTPGDPRALSTLSDGAFVNTFRNDLLHNTQHMSLILTAELEFGLVGQKQALIYIHVYRMY